MRHAVALGARVAGLAPAKAPARYADPVTIIERDPAPASGSTVRRGLPQAPQLTVTMYDRIAASDPTSDRPDLRPGPVAASRCCTVLHCPRSHVGPRISCRITGAITANNAGAVQHLDRPELLTAARRIQMAQPDTAISQPQPRTFIDLLSRFKAGEFSAARAARPTRGQ